MNWDYVAAVISCVLRLALTGVVVFSLVRFGTVLNQTQRFGLGLVGGSSFLTVPVIFDVDKTGTPFDIWAGMLLTIGCGVYFIGAMSRMYGHEWRNALAVERAKAYLDGKREGKQ